MKKNSGRGVASAAFLFDFNRYFQKNIYICNINLTI